MPCLCGAVENEIIPDPVTEEEKEKEAEAATKRAETVGTILSKKEGGGGKGKPAKGKPAAKGKGKAPPPKKGGKGKNEPEEEPDTRHEYEKAGTSAGFTLEFNEPLVLAVPEPPAPETKPSDLVSSSMNLSLSQPTSQPLTLHCCLILSLVRLPLCWVRSCSGAASRSLAAWAPRPSANRGIPSRRHSCGARLGRGVCECRHR